MTLLPMKMETMKLLLIAQQNSYSMMFFCKKLIICVAILGLASCKGLGQIEKVNIQDETNGLVLSTNNLSSHKPALGDSIMFEINGEKLKRHLEQNKAVWLHFVYSRLCADAEIYDCETYKELNEKYRDKISYVMVTEIAHSNLARELKKGCKLVGYHTYVDDKKRVHNEVKALRKLKKEVFGFENNDTLMIQTNYLIINNQIVYASDQTLDRGKIEVILNKL
ncbi:MAG: hypothetical protein EAY81_08345 [Bacteroidetes bacterium]|nr:MAG: hypothetical protein EAY81_08345 [Bacteroidota bacterium]